MADIIFFGRVPRSPWVRLYCLTIKQHASRRLMRRGRRHSNASCRDSGCIAHCLTRSIGRLGAAVGLLIYWMIIRSAMDELAPFFEPLGYRLVAGEWQNPDDPVWKLTEDT